MDMEEVRRPMQEKLSGDSLLPSWRPYKNLLPRSFSTKSSNYSASYLSLNSSQKSSVSPKVSLMRSLSQRMSDIMRRCSNLVREHKARLYITKRCVGVLARWHRDGDC